jgi:DNA-binding transcriptional MocR family regulator
MGDWRPKLEFGEGFIHQRIVQALEADIAAGVLSPDTRLPTHRRLAETLGVGVGAVTRAYAEAEVRGLVTAHVGRGSFVARPAERLSPASQGPINLGLNLPPSAGAESRLSDSLARLRRRGDLLEHLDYGPASGFDSHRRAGAAWMEVSAGWPDLDWRRLICTSGAQQAIASALAAAIRPGDGLIVEEATFSGIKALAAHMNYQLVGAGMDAEGLTPDALDEAVARSGARAVYIQPLQNPTGRIMGLERRKAIVEVARRRGVMIVEDDLYSAYAATEGQAGPVPLARLAPEQVFYVNGLSKSLTPGLRMGYLVPPVGGDWSARALAALRAIAFGPPGIGGLIAAQWIEDGTAAEVLAAHRAELTARARLAVAALGAVAERPANIAATHLWLPMSELEAERASARMLRAGVQVTPPEAPQIPGSRTHGLRVCLGGPPNRAVFEEGLRRLTRALGAASEPALGMV